MECKKNINMERCNCTYPGCTHKGLCCECIEYHKSKRQLPGCFFPQDAEATWDRSYEYFAELVKNKKV